MAKDESRDGNNVNSAGIGSTIGTVILIIFIILVWLAIFALLIKMDVGGMGSKLRPLIKDIPVLNLILPDATDEELIEENNYPYKNIDEAVEVIKKLEDQIDVLNETDEANRKKILELQNEVARLKGFEADREAFEERVKRFDVNVVYNSQAPDIEEYKKYYEEINPETAEEIYRQVVEQLQYDEMIKQKADLIRNMKPAQAAKALEEMTADLEYTCKILLSMKPTEATPIMDKMDSLFVARVLQTMHDMDEEYYAKVSKNFLN
jgi:flagellar motility protein MotE (MotC chaperone)